MKKLIYLLALSLVLSSCKPSSSTEPENNTSKATNHVLADTLATKETVALFENLQAVSVDKLLFGHHDDTAYGVGWSGVFGRSDILEVCGDYPAVYGWDLGSVIKPQNVGGSDYEYKITLIKQAFRRGGINTISMHIDNPASGGDAWDNSPAVATILPGGVNHSEYLKLLDRVADFMLRLKSDDGRLIPIIYRPYHEHNHTWSWWGASACTAEEYNNLWKMTVEYLRDTRKVHNLLYAISPQDVFSVSEYLARYPGDKYVDVLGYDCYELYKTANVDRLGMALDVLAKMAESKGKILALTEVGIENVYINDWFTNYLLKAVKYSSYSLKTCWGLVWRNESTGHHFAPYPGHSSVPDFLVFYNDPVTVFEKDLPAMYK